MPIIGMTDAASVVPQFPRIGKLRKGGEAVEKTKADGSAYKTYGADLEYFRFTEERPGVAAAFTAAFGATPSTLRVFLPYPTTSENFPTWAEKWTAQGLAARGDGQTIHQWRTPDGKYSFAPQPMPVDWQDSKEWRGVGRLSVIIPELVKAGFVGYVTLETGSKWDMIGITKSLLKAQLESELNGHTLQGIEFILRRQWVEIATPRPGGLRAMTKKNLVFIEPAPTWVRIQMALAERSALEAPEARLQLADGRTVDGATGEIHDEAPPAFEDDEEPGEFRPLNPDPAPAKSPAAQAPVSNDGSGQQPVCPICGGPMWDNREKIKTTGKKMPEWSCKAGKYDAATKTKSGCEGVLWPGQFVPKASAAAAKVSKAQVNELGELIKSVYGTDPAELAKVKKFMQERFQVADRSKLTAAQADEFAAILIEMLNKLTAAGQPELIPGEPVAPSTAYDEEIPF